MASGLPSPWPPRFPPTAAGIQVNHCKNPRCDNFGVPPKPESKRGAHAVRAADVGPGDYTVVAAGENQPQLKCRLCGEIFLMQSNVAIAEELMRISHYLEPVMPRCPNASCELAGQAPNPANFTRFGVNAAGSPRYRCGGCKKVFAFGGPATKGQHTTHRNRDILQHLMNAMPLRRIVKVLDISFTVLYDRIDFLYEQCQLFAGERERTLLDRDLGKLYLSIDRQKLLVNWTTKASRKNTQLLSIATADQATGYVFAANINFDGTLDSAAVQQDGLRYGYDRLPKAFRRHARVWLATDWEEATAAYALQVLRSKAAAKAPKSKRMKESIEAVYENMLERDDLDDGEGPSPHARTPLKGMVLHEMAVMNAHVQLVTRLLQRAEKLRFFIDQESGLRAAIMAAVPDRVRNRTVDAFYVKVMKDFTIDEKRAKVALANRRVKDVADGNGCGRDRAKLLMARQELTVMPALGKWGDRWFRHPGADMREPEKAVCWLTDIDTPEEEYDKREDQLNHIARLHLKASLTSVDRFFVQVRRALTVAERGVISASADRRLWFGKNAYNPDVLVKLVAIFRTYINYCEVGEDGKTPAVRLGLARGPVAPEDIVYFTPEQPARRRAPAAASTGKAQPFAISSSS